MPLDRETLERMSREELVAAARQLSVRHPELMTRVELTDEILRLTERADPGAPSGRGWLGVARDLLARLVERGLHLPHAAALIRGAPPRFGQSRVQTPVATVTLAEIYAAQGHVTRALRMLDEVLEGEPDHAAARTLRDRLGAERGQRKVASRRRDLAARERGAGTKADWAVVTIAAEGERLYVYWELDPRAVEQLSRLYPDGRAVVRVVSFQPSWDGAQRTERDLPADPRLGGAPVERTSPDSVVRAVLGWKAGQLFRPLAVDLGLNPQGESTGSWLPPRAEQAATADLRERALEAYRAA